MKGLRLISLLFAVLLSSTCNLIDERIDGSCPQLSITLEFPQATMVKGDEGEMPASSAENIINTIQIWVFKSVGHQKVNYLCLNRGDDVHADYFPEGGTAKRYAMQVSREFAIERPDVDIFVLANAASIGKYSGENALVEGSSWEDVRNAAFGGDYFGIDHTDLPDTGLPMSACGMNLKVGGEDPSLSVATVSLQRCVSKIHFYFSQTLTTGEEAEQVEITGIELDGGFIPVSENVFSPYGGASISGGYLDEGISITRSGNIASSDAPERYGFAGKDGVTYERMMTEAIDAGEVTDGGVLYLRESDKLLTGKIRYKVNNGDIRTATFQMADAGDFARNHTWAVYGYFITDRTMQLALNVLPWDYSKYTINFSTDALMVTQKLTVVPESAYIEQIKDPDTGEPVKDQFNVYLKTNQPAQAYLYVATPENGWLIIEKDGDRNYFTVSPEEVRIDPGTRAGRIDISIASAGLTNSSGKSIVLSFRAFTPDKEREIPGASECIDQVYHFILQ